ncbi:hypothetical protein B0H16DRAFT_1306595 [Mycena metata]|uniref:BTB domain-containing protein n=1 Tax=Mycena metata TaxID=1033252 RepID=A0AAD7JRL2_9AGAR|nr:hypothetical protein B0H16DRAFT_1306595 [Mycena metata]
MESDVMRSEIWYSDGSVVLQAQNTQFRVHFSILSLHSTFFRSMQGLPQPRDQPTVEGCPLIVLHDSVADVENLLKALYNPDLFNDEAIPFAYIASFVRLGRKYEFMSLLKIALGRLAFENPPTLKEYDALLETLRLAAGKYVPHSTTRIVDYPGIRQDTVTLARENGLVALLPCAYYRVLSGGAAEIFKSTLQPDGTNSQLSCTDHRICTVGLERILAVQFKSDSALGWVLRKPADGCKDVSACQLWHDAFTSTVLASRPKLYNPSVFWLQNESTLCVFCKAQATRALIAGRAKFWENLPSFFDLNPWSELKNDI